MGYEEEVTTDREPYAQNTPTNVLRAERRGWYPDGCRWPAATEYHSWFCFGRGLSELEEGWWHSQRGVSWHGLQTKGVGVLVGIWRQAVLPVASKIAESHPWGSGTGNCDSSNYSRGCTSQYLQAYQYRWYSAEQPGNSKCNLCRTCY